MVGAERKHIEHEFSQRTVAKIAGFGEESVKFHLVITNASLTDEEVTKLKDLVSKAAEDANTLLGW